MENALLERERMDRMLEAGTVEEAAKVLTECGYPELQAVNVDTVDAMLAQAREELFGTLNDLAPDGEILDVFKVKYDYHKVMADAIVEARAVLGKTRDPQRSDMILDQAYFQEMEQLAKDSGSQFLLGYVQMLVDAANLRSVVRVLRMGRDADFLATVLFPGGAIPAATVVKAADGEPLESIYFSSLFEEAAAAGVQAIQGGSLTAFEKACDNALNAYMQKAKYIPFGEQPMLGYVSAKDNEFTAIRIILTGRLADLPADVIRERLRNAYV